MTLLCGENVSRRISEGRPGDGKGKKDSKGKKEGKKKPSVERGSCLPRKERKRTQAQTYGQYGYKKALKHFCLRTSVKTATTYSPTCAVPSA